MILKQGATSADSYCQSLFTFKTEEMSNFVCWDRDFGCRSDGMIISYACNSDVADYLTEAGLSTVKSSFHSCSELVLYIGDSCVSPISRRYFSGFC